jgi:hypothetical protein
MWKKVWKCSEVHICIITPILENKTDFWSYTLIRNNVTKEKKIEILYYIHMKPCDPYV